MKTRQICRNLNQIDSSHLNDISDIYNKISFFITKFETKNLEPEQKKTRVPQECTNFVKYRPINMSRMKAGKSPNEGLSLTNRVVLNPRDHAALGEKRHVQIVLPSQNGYIFTVERNDSMQAGKNRLIYSKLTQIFNIYADSEPLENISSFTFYRTELDCMYFQQNFSTPY